MKTLILIFTLMTVLRIQAEDMHKYLSETNDLARTGKHEEALKRHIWYHDHALEHAPGMYGVRLSFALGGWKELGEKYPPAMKALVEVRDRKMKSILDGKESHNLFQDVAAINEVLGEPEKTVSLFEQVDEKQPKVAKGYWNVAKDAVIDAKRYDLAGKYIGDPVSEFIRVKDMYAQGMRLYNDPRVSEDGLKAYIKASIENDLVEESLQLIEGCNALNNSKAALEIQASALALVEDPRLRDAIPGDKKQEAQSGRSRD